MSSWDDPRPSPSESLAASASSGPAPAGPPGPPVGAVGGVGIDAVDVARFREVLARRPSLVERIFTDGEQADARRGQDPVPRLAARFAAKEATMKALGSGIGGIAFRDVEVVRQGGRGATAGAPRLVLRDTAARLAARRQLGGLRVSMTHTAQVAMAVVVGEPALQGPHPEPAVGEPGGEPASGRPAGSVGGAPSAGATTGTGGTEGTPR